MTKINIYIVIKYENTKYIQFISSLFGHYNGWYYNVDEFINNIILFWKCQST